MPFSEAVLYAALGFAAFYTAGIVAIALVLRRVRQSPPAAERTVWPSVTVIVAARNEEDHIGDCIDALLKQAYNGPVEIVIVNDGSTDGTADQVRTGMPATHQKGTHQVRLMEAGEPIGHVRGKALAIHRAIEATSSPYLVITDADCRPPASWLASVVDRLDRDGTGMVCGITAVSPQVTVDDRVQAIDWVYLFSIASAASEFGYAITAMGNNMAIRREAYEAVGGYPKLPFSVTEDYVLFQAVSRLPNFEVYLPFNKSLLNTTLPAPSVLHAFRQRKRWARGGLRVPAWVYGLYTIGIATHALLPVALLLAPVPALMGILTKALGDVYLLRTASRRLGLPLRLIDVPAFEAYLTAYMVGVPLSLLVQPRIRWKAREL